MSQDSEDLDELIGIAAALNAERDINALLGLILERSRYITQADAGSVYVLTGRPDAAEGQRLRFEIAQNDSVKIDLASRELPISSKSVVGAAVLRRSSINIPDLRALGADPASDFDHDSSFDDRIGYQTRSVLTVPMINARDHVIGVIQLINRKRDAQAKLASAEDFDQQVEPFDPRSESLAKTLAYQAAIALDNAQLFHELQTVFEGFVEASVSAIEARDPTTSGHSRRVADLTVGLARATDRTDAGPYKSLQFDDDQLKEIEYAGLLHDFGKVGVPEHVLVKPEKLHPWDRELILARFDYIRQWLRAEGLELQLALAQQRGPEKDRARIEQRITSLGEEQKFLDRCVEVVLSANRPSVLEQTASELLGEVAQRVYTGPRGDELPYLTADELACLQVRRGSLNADERRQIESHVVHSFNFLCKIPWGRNFRDIPAIAADHHEKLDGSGYPAGKTADEIPVQAKMMTIADIFDALTAADRPYKPAIPLERALAILDDEVRRNKLDADLLNIFLEARVYTKVL